MAKFKKYLLYPLLALLSLVLLYIVGVLIYGTLNDWQPPAETDLGQGDQQSATTLITDSVLSFAIWNIGYGGLGAESEFFLDGEGMAHSNGRMVYASEEKVEEYTQGIAVSAQATQTDFFLFQEVDRRARRSYYQDQQQLLQAQKPAYASFFAANYKSPWVPIPVLEPWKAYGEVHSGLLTLSRYQPFESKRLQLPGEFGWPIKLFQLDRCVAVHRYRVEGDRQLVVMNVHNSAFDADGSVKAQQMAFLQQLFLQEYEQGHYVIVGGDWNQCPPFFRFDGFAPNHPHGYTQINIEPDFLPSDWQWGYDPRTPTNRKLRTPYVPGESFITIIDFFLVSPNVRIREIRGIDQQFRFSDHQPVWMEVELIK